MRVNQTQKLVIHRVGFFFFRGAQGFGRAMAQVILHKVSRHAAKRFLRRSNLGDDVRAVAIFFHHPLQTADLSFDTAEAFLIGCFQGRVDGQGFVPGTDPAGTISALWLGFVPGVGLSRHRSYTP
jgi:hypothetical protein